MRYNITVALRDRDGDLADRLLEHRPKNVPLSDFCRTLIAAGMDKLFPEKGKGKIKGPKAKGQS